MFTKEDFEDLSEYIDIIHIAFRHDIFRWIEDSDSIQFM